MNQAIIHNKTKGKTLSLIGGSMGVGKTTVGQRLKKELPDCVLLDGDALWDADPFHVTEETKAMVLRNSLFVLNEFLHGTALIFGAPIAYLLINFLAFAKYEGDGNNAWKFYLVPISAIALSFLVIFLAS